MKKIVLSLFLFSCAIVANAQSEMDAYRLSQTDLKGSARFVSMAGAFGALGGDVSVLGNNPGGIGVFRRSEVSFTLGGTGISSQAVGSDPFRKEEFAFDNFTYIGSFSAGTNRFNVGVGYNKVKSFDREFEGGVGGLQGSLSDLIGSYAKGMPTNISDRKAYKDPYDTKFDWFGILGSEAGVIKPKDTSVEAQEYESSFDRSSTPTVYSGLVESGSVSEYNFTFGGDIKNIVSYGVSVGVWDINYRVSSYYEEDHSLPNKEHYFTLKNRLTTRGSGVNIKGGVIVRPIENLRLSFAAHTPTWLYLRDTYTATMEHSEMINDRLDTKQATAPLSENSPAYSRYRFNTPFRLQAGAAYVIPLGLISFEYEMADYSSGRLSDADGYAKEVDNQFIKEDFQASHTFKVGLEFRLTKQLSLRGGYSYQTSPVKSSLPNGEVEVLTSGTLPHYYYDRSTQYITAGVGYRFNNLYVDLAYVHRANHQDYWGYTPSYFVEGKEIAAPVWDVRTYHNSGLLTVGYRF